jgi:hypothetical protein
MPNASKLMPACATIPAYSIGGTPVALLAWYSPNGCVIVTSVLALGSSDFTCETSRRVSSMICSKLSVNAVFVCSPATTFHAPTALR